MRRFVLTTLVLGSLHLGGLAFFHSTSERTAQAQPLAAVQPVQAPLPTQAQPAPFQGASSFQTGEKLFVEWHGRFWPARVLSVADADHAVIHYDGYGPEWDETISSARALREVGSATQRAGESVFIEWQGSWWPAKVRAVKKDGWAIRYDGYGPEWDETVGASRIKTLQ